MKTKPTRTTGLLLAACAVVAGCGSEDVTTPEPTTWPAPDAVSVEAPPKLAAVPDPADNPTTRQGIELGRRLFYDTRLSGDGSMSCATCHRQQFAFSDGGQRFSDGIDGILGTRNTPHLTNVAYAPQLFWDGRAPRLEDQAREPVVNPIEMHTTWPDVVARLEQDPEYPDLFGRAFGSDTISEDRIVQAIAQFQRTFVSSNSLYVRWRVSNGSIPYPDAAKRGYVMFFSEVADCFHCHNDWSFSIEEFRDIGLDALPDSGLAAVTGRAEDLGRFKIPTLFNVAVTAPYMHDGRFATLEEVLDHYNSGGHRSPNVDPFIRVGTGLGLTPEQKSDLIAFLHTLTDSTFLQNPDLSNPFR
jgi:cytochrome c peroxidase